MFDEKKAPSRMRTFRFNEAMEKDLSFLMDLWGCTATDVVPTDWTALLAGDVSKIFNFAFIIPGILFSFPVVKKIRLNETGVVSAVAVNCMYIALFAICIAFIISSSYNPFIYFRF